jgi:tyrosine decarboxylase / aspartate 1-decarboxylase
VSRQPLGWAPAELGLLQAAAQRLEEGFANVAAMGSDSHRPTDSAGRDDFGAMETVLLEIAQRLQDNFPYFHPLYAGQMLKPPHPMARLAYALAMLINPNNHALDGGRASSAMEKEAVAQLAAMVGWEGALGHLTGGGTLANLEALWIAGRLAPGQTVVASAQAHYTHPRVSEVLGLPFEAVAVDALGRIDTAALERRLARAGVGTVVATLGTTAFGAVDALDELIALRARHGFRLHVDAAYGGYFVLADGLHEPARRAFAAMRDADSLVIDPHKHGLQPYGCGAVLQRDPTVGRFYRHDSPYTYFSSQDLHLGEISLECSRAGAAAVALWATQRLLPPVRGGAFAGGLDRCLRAARELYARLHDDARFLTLMAPDLDIVVWAPAGVSAAAITARSQHLFRAAAERNLHLALVRVPAELAAAHWPHVAFEGAADVTCLRSCLMKFEHLDWIDEIWLALDQACS